MYLIISSKNNIIITNHKFVYDKFVKKNYFVIHIIIYHIIKKLLNLI